MVLLAKCPQCKQKIELKLDDADKRKQCPQCRRLFHVPAAESLGNALNVLKTARSQVYVDEQGRLYG